MPLESQQSNQVTVMVSDALAPAKVQNLRYTVSQGKVSLAWDPVTTNSDSSPLTDLAAYRVYRKDDEGSSPVLVGTVASTIDNQVTNFDDTTMLDGASYLYIVTAVDNEATPNESVASDELPVKTIPSVPQNLQATSGDGHTHLTWDSVLDGGNAKKNENLAGYNVYRSDDGGATFNKIGSVDKNTLSYQDNTVAIGQQYIYAVTAFDNSP
ncbi:fibronectin type III domain-containing protein [Alicyclobacillus shizuokensis]|uniref:fibronectin type III domain-containing protein n=1 Tax=Alicyclobacillus shizuokensis TaxID=392014 RepID=UPI0008336E58|nr:hypothetical protein [Alicyclobacillus shizuokensis]